MRDAVHPERAIQLSTRVVSHQRRMSSVDIRVKRRDDLSVMLQDHLRCRLIDALAAKWISPGSKVIAIGADLANLAFGVGKIAHATPHDSPVRPDTDHLRRGIQKLQIPGAR